MATLAKLIVSIGANTAEFESNLKKASSQLKGFKTDITALSPAFDAIGRAIKVVGVAMIGAFVGGGTAALVSAAKIEQYRLSLDTLMGSSKAAGEAVANAVNLSSKTPFTDEQLLAATVALEKFGQDAKTVLPQVANMAAATNGDVEAAAAAFGGFLQGRTRALASYGITKAAVLAEGAKTEQGIQIANEKGQIVNEAAYNAALLSLMDERFKGGAQKQADSISGLKTRMKSAADDALRTIAGVTDSGDILAGGLADTFKKAVTMIIAKIDEWKANGSLQRWATDVGQAITVFFNGAKVVFSWLVNIATFIAKNWQAIVPVIGAVVGAFVAFKVVATYVTLATTAIKLFGSAASIAALGPIALIIGAVALLAAGITYLIEKQQQENALLNPSLVGAASVKHIQDLTAAMTEYDAVTEKTGSAMLEQHQAGYYASRVAGHQKYVNDLKQQNDLLAKAALDSRNATSKGTEAGYAKDVAAAKTATVAKVALDADLENKIYDLTHSELQNKLHAIDVEAAKDLADGKNKVQVAEWVKVAKAKANKDAFDAAAKLGEAATKKTSEEATKILGINTDLNDKIYKLSHTTVEGQIYDLARERDAAIADGGSKLKADKAYTLAAKKVYDDARKAKAEADKTARDKEAAAAKDAQDKYLASLADYASKEKDVFTSLTQYIVDSYNLEKTKAVDALNVERDKAVNTLDDMITARQDALSSTLDAISEGKTSAVDALNAERDAAVNALNDMVDARQDELSSTLDMLSTEKDAAVSAVEKERDATLNALDDMITARQNEMNSTLDAISQEKDAVLGQYDAQIQALQDANAGVQDENTIAGLQADIAAAQTAVNDTKTYEDRAVAQEVLNKAKTALDKEMYTESYNAQLSSLQKQRKAASDTYDAETTAAKKAGDKQIQTLKDTLAAAQTSYAARLTSTNAYYDAEIIAVKKAGDAEIQSLKDTLAAAQTSYAARLTSTNAYYDALTTAVTKAGNAEIQRLKDSLTAVQKSYTDQLAAINTYYDQKLATANINADAEELLATKTSDEILAMLQGKLSEYADLGAQYGNALYSGVLAAQGAYAALQQTAVQVQPNGSAPAGLSVGTTVTTAGGDYKITAVKPDGSYTSVPVAPVTPSLFGGGSSRMLMAHANGGYFTTPHIGLIAENGPEAVVPQSQFAAFANQVGGGDTAAGLRQLGLKLDMLTSAVRQVAPGVGAAVNGLGRA